MYSNITQEEKDLDLWPKFAKLKKVLQHQIKIGMLCYDENEGGDWGRYIQKGFLDKLDKISLMEARLRVAEIKKLDIWDMWTDIHGLGPAMDLIEELAKSLGCY